MSKWEVSTFEDRLLEAYWEKMDGGIFTEVQIGGNGPSEWPDGSKTRRIDAVKILGPENEKDGIFDYNRHKKYFIKNSRDSNVELIEIKSKLNRPVIGQLLVGEEMFRKDYEPNSISLTILCSEGDPALKWVCDEKDINLEISEQKF